MVVGDPPHSVIGWGEEARIGGTGRTGSITALVPCFGQHRDGDCSWPCGTAGGEVEAAAAAHCLAVSANVFVIARERCD